MDSTKTAPLDRNSNEHASQIYEYYLTYLSFLGHVDWLIQSYVIKKNIKTTIL